MENDKQADNKTYVIIRQGKIISYDRENCYVNNDVIGKTAVQHTNQKQYDKDKCCANDAEMGKTAEQHTDPKQIAEEKKKEFYNSFFKKHYQNIVVLTAAGTSMDNGTEECGKTRDGLWTHCENEINTFKNKVEGLEQKQFYNDKNIENLLSHLILYKKVNDTDVDFENNIKALEEKIAEACKLTLQKDAPHKTFLNKITARKPSDSRVQLFTTNYDTLFEQAANKAGFVVIDGFSFTQPREFAGRHFDYDIVNRERTRLKDEDSFIKKVFHLYKLHGSLDWTKDENGKIIQSENTKAPLIIYPASEKYESSYEQPYFEMMSRFQQVLRKDNVLLIVVGFGFRDKHIQNVILEAVEQNPSFQLVVIYYDPAGSGENRTNEDASKKKTTLPDLFVDDNQEIVKRNVTIIFDSFKNFTNNYPENQTYTDNETI